MCFIFSSHCSCMVSISNIDLNYCRVGEIKFFSKNIPDLSSQFNYIFSARTGPQIREPGNCFKEILGVNEIIRFVYVLFFHVKELGSYTIPFVPSWFSFFISSIFSIKFIIITWFIINYPYGITMIF